MRYALCVNDCFTQSDNISKGKSHSWRIREDYLTSFKNGDYSIKKSTRNRPSVSSPGHPQQNTQQNWLLHGHDQYYQQWHQGQQNNQFQHVPSYQWQNPNHQIR